MKRTLISIILLAGFAFSATILTACSKTPTAASSKATPVSASQNLVEKGYIVATSTISTSSKETDLTHYTFISYTTVVDPDALTNCTQYKYQVIENTDAEATVTRAVDSGIGCWEADSTLTCTAKPADTADTKYLQLGIDGEYQEYQILKYNFTVNLDEKYKGFTSMGFKTTIDQAALDTESVKYRLVAANQGLDNSSSGNYHTFRIYEVFDKTLTE